MSFDGITIRSLAVELKESLKDGYIRKIIQPEKEELLISVKTKEATKKILMSANASLPLLYLTDANPPAPKTAPNFCMLLRKYLGGGKITSIEQLGNERVVCFTVEHRGDLGDASKKNLYIEIMGRHSNIIFCDNEGTIIDGIKRVSLATSSVRQILPQKSYFVPRQEGKTDPYVETEEGFLNKLLSAHTKLSIAIQNNYVGISRITAAEIAHRAGLDADSSTDSLLKKDAESLSASFFALLKAVKAASEKPCIAYEPESGEPIEFAPYRLSIYEDKKLVFYDSISLALSVFYESKNKTVNIRQKSADLRKLVSTLLERNQKKLNIQEKQLDDTKKMEKFKTYGTLLQIYPHEAGPKAKEVILIDFETGEPVRIPLDPNLDSIANANLYFERYSKLKRTKEALATQLDETHKAIMHLASIQNAISFAESEADLSDIRKELFEAGYTKKGSKKKDRRPEKSKPLHYATKDGFHIYVGKNNFQNDELTFKFANSSDWWFHAKQIPGSHVIVRTEGRELPDDVFVLCARIAGFFSQGRQSDKLEIDYVQRKHVKKPSGSAPGFVVYYTNYSMTVPPTFPEEVEKLKD